MTSFLPESIDLSCFINLKSKIENTLKTGEKSNLNITELTDSIESIILTRSPHTGCVFHLPSLESLAKFFACSYLEIHDAFRLLRERGYEYEFTHVDETLLVWKNVDTSIGD